MQESRKKSLKKSDFVIFFYHQTADATLSGITFHKLIYAYLPVFTLPYRSHEWTWDSVSHSCPELPDPVVALQFCYLQRDSGWTYPLLAYQRAIWSSICTHITGTWAGSK